MSIALIDEVVLTQRSRWATLSHNVVAVEQMISNVKAEILNTIISDDVVQKLRTSAKKGA